MTDYLVAVKVDDEKALFSFPTEEDQEDFIDAVEDLYGEKVDWVKTVDDEDEESEDEDEEKEE